MCVMLRRVFLCLQLQMPDVSCWRPDAPGTTKDGVTHDTLTPDVCETADGPVLSDVGRKQVSASHELDMTEVSASHELGMTEVSASHELGMTKVSASHELDITERACCVCGCTHM